MSIIRIVLELENERTDIMHNTFGTKQYFLEAFKQTVMNNFTIHPPVSLMDLYDHYQSEIAVRLPLSEQPSCRANLQQAYQEIRQELVFSKEAADESK
ncbi:hypothetical protein PNH38_05455 [Anoxybacillus rupiensis]|uniref:Uncharacterized protein n=2 Tax=Bacillales TaxID=1385 RepID=A0ABT5W1Y0_9BACL|nr:hypothetical protein [Anoxybacillus rupiensis]